MLQRIRRATFRSTPSKDTAAALDDISSLSTLTPPVASGRKSSVAGGAGLEDAGTPAATNSKRVESSAPNPGAGRRMRLPQWLRRTKGGADAASQGAGAPPRTPMTPQQLRDHAKFGSSPHLTAHEKGPLTTAEWVAILRRVTRMYEAWNPERLRKDPNFPRATMRRWEGRERLLMKALVYKYGPEPDEADPAAHPKSGARRPSAGRSPSSVRPPSSTSPPASRRASPTPQSTRTVRSASFRSARRRVDSGEALSARALAVEPASLAPGDGAGDVGGAQPQDGAPRRPSSPASSTAALAGRVGEGADWMGTDDEEQRIAFLSQLAERQLPMPQTEGQFHASRMYVDELGRSVYDIETWLDYIQIKGYTNTGRTRAVIGGKSVIGGDEEG
jgi:hypothetical protein